MTHKTTRVNDRFCLMTKRQTQALVSTFLLSPAFSCLVCLDVSLMEKNSAETRMVPCVG